MHPSIKVLTPHGSAMRLRRPSYATEQALILVAACALLGSGAGLLYALLNP